MGIIGTKTNTLIIFTNQLSSMLTAGLPLPKIFASLTTEILDKKFTKVLTSVKEDIEGGTDLSDAVSRHPRVFNPISINMIKAGMTTGRLDETMDQLYRYLKTAGEREGKLRSAITYPIFMFSFLILTIIIMLVYVLPKFKKIYLGFGADLPAPTMFLLNTSDFIVNYWQVLIIFLVGSIAAMWISINTKIGRLFWDKKKFSIPVLGKTIKMTAVAKTLRTLGVLLASEVPILEALELVSSSSGNKYVELKLMEISKKIEKGYMISNAFRETDIFPEIVIQMITSGEETGNIGSMATSCADFYEQQAENSINSLISMLNPIITMSVGIIIGGIMLAIFLPIFDLGTALRQGGAKR